MELAISTAEAAEVVDVTDRVEAAIPDDVRSGTCTVFSPHTTAGVAVNEAEPLLMADVEAALSRLVPPSAGYRHDEIDDNAAAHLRTMLVGESVTVPVTDGSLSLGTWQSVLLLEGDGPRERTLQVVVAEAGAS